MMSDECRQFIVHRSSFIICFAGTPYAGQRGMEKSGEGTLPPGEAWELPRTETPADQNWSSAGPSAKVPGKEVPDERLRQDVCDRLMQFGPADCVELEVSVSGGIVTVAGTLASRELHQRLFEVIRSVAGVRDIDDQLRVNDE